jgi:hypothetical protein
MRLGATSEPARRAALLRRWFMIKSSTAGPRAACYELRFTGLFNRGRGYAFPCDAEGHVDIDELTERGRINYLFARTVVGSELSPPIVAPVA